MLSGQHFSVAGMGRALAKPARRRPPRFSTFAPHTLARHQGASHEKAARVLGYNPPPFGETLRDMFEWSSTVAMLGEGSNVMLPRKSDVSPRSQALGNALVREAALRDTGAWPRRRKAAAWPRALKRICLCTAAAFLAVLAAGMAAAAPIPSFEQLDKELGKYKHKADLKGETNAHLQTDNLAFYCLFDLFLTAVNNPKDPRHAETRKAWDHNYDTYQDQAGFVAKFMGRNLIPLLITTSALYAKDFREGSKFYAPRFRPEDYLHPQSTEVLCDGKTDRVAWWHGAADADGDKVSNADELKAVAPDWQKQGVTGAVRARFIHEAAGVEVWFAAKPQPEERATGTTVESFKK